MDDLEEIRRRRLQELQRRQQEGAATGQDPEAAQRAQEEAAIESLLQQILEPEARERLTRIRMSRPEFADQVVAQLVALVRGRRLQRRMSDADLRSVLAQLSPPDRDFNITRK